MHAKQCFQHALSLTVLQLNHYFIEGGGKSCVLIIILGKGFALGAVKCLTCPGGGGSEMKIAGSLAV